MPHSGLKQTGSGNPDKTSTTVITDDLMMKAEIAAKKGTAVATVDFPGAFLEFPIPDNVPPTHASLIRYIRRIMTEIEGRHEQFYEGIGA